MRRMRSFSSICLMTVLAVVAIGAGKPKFIQPGEVDWASIISGPPANDSAEHQTEIATMLHWQAKRTAEDVERCKFESSADEFVFATVLGDWFNRRSLPVTANLLDQAFIDTTSVTALAKEKWNRPRPFKEDPRIKPVVFLEVTPSYPSGHAARGVVWATILSELFPEHHEALMARGREFGDDRVIAGVHWPSDVEAGQKLGVEIAKKLMDNPDFKNELEWARAECLATAH